MFALSAHRSFDYLHQTLVMNVRFSVLQYSDTGEQKRRWVPHNQVSNNRASPELFCRYCFARSAGTEKGVCTASLEACPTPQAAGKLDQPCRARRHSRVLFVPTCRGGGDQLCG